MEGAGKGRGSEFKSEKCFKPGESPWETLATQARVYNKDFGANSQTVITEGHIPSAGQATICVANFLWPIDTTNIIDLHQGIIINE